MEKIDKEFSPKVTIATRPLILSAISKGVVQNNYKNKAIEEILVLKILNNAISAAAPL